MGRRVRVSRRLDAEAAHLPVVVSAVSDAGDAVYAEARRRLAAHRDTGQLLDSLEVVRGTTDTVVKASVKIKYKGGTVDLAALIEYGYHPRGGGRFVPGAYALTKAAASVQK